MSRNRVFGISAFILFSLSSLLMFRALVFWVQTDMTLWITLWYLRDEVIITLLGVVTGLFLLDKQNTQ